MFPLIAVPFGIRNRKGSKFTGFAYSLLFFLFYYLLLTFGKNFGEEGRVSPFISMWLPNIISGLVGLVFLILEARERSYGFAVFFIHLKEKMVFSKVFVRFMNKLSGKQIHKGFNFNQKFPGFVKIPGKGAGRDHL